jgi:hypothetical protein
MQSSVELLRRLKEQHDKRTVSVLVGAGSMQICPRQVSVHTSCLYKKIIVEETFFSHARSH